MYPEAARVIHENLRMKERDIIISSLMATESSNLLEQIVLRPVAEDYSALFMLLDQAKVLPE